MCIGLAVPMCQSDFYLRKEQKIANEIWPDWGQNLKEVSNVNIKESVVHEQCDLIGRKVLGNKFAYKSTPKRLLIFGLF